MADAPETPDAPETIDTTPSIVRLLVLHSAVIAVPILLIGLVVGLRLLAVVLALALGAFITFVRVRDADERIRTNLVARAVTATDEPRLANLAESVAMATGTPVPALFVIDSAAANAVTWGIASGPANLALTRGLLDATTRVELEAVLGHHAALVRTGAVDAVTLGATLFGPFAKGPLLEPLASLVNLGLDQHSIVLADLDGVRATRYPPGMVAALERLHGMDTLVADVPLALSGLCFAAPHPTASPFDLHPPLEDRIDLLREV